MREEKGVKNKELLSLVLHDDMDKVAELGYLMIWDKAFAEYMWNRHAIDMSKDL